MVPSAIDRTSASHLQIIAVDECEKVHLLALAEIIPMQAILRGR